MKRVGRTRAVIAIASWLFPFCALLPAELVVGRLNMPIGYPPLWGVYLGALAVATIAGSTVLRTRRRAFLLLAIAYLVSLAAPLFMELVDDIWLSSAFALGFAAMIAIVIRSLAGPAWSERTLAAACMLHGLLATGLNALVVLTSRPLWGAYVALVPASCIAIAGTAWFVREHRALRAASSAAQAAPLPVARIH